MVVVVVMVGIMINFFHFVYFFVTIFVVDKDLIEFFDDIIFEVEHLPTQRAESLVFFEEVC